MTKGLTHPTEFLFVCSVLTLQVNTEQTKNVKYHVAAGESSLLHMS